MTLKEIVNQLRQEGQAVKYRVRSDGGIIITEIGEQKYKGAKGNIRARQLAGVELSQPRLSQLKRALKIREEKVQKKIKKFAPLTKEVRNTIARIQRRIQKNKDLSKKIGRVERNTFRKLVAKYGEAGAVQHLKQYERYVKGYANSKNIAWLQYRIESFGKQAEINISGLNLIIEKIGSRFKDEDINTLNQIMYNKNLSPQQRISEAIKYLRIKYKIV